MVWMLFIFIGLVSGLLSGIFGLGGGIVIVPALTTIFIWQPFAFDNLMQMSTGTSLATITITSLAAIVFHHQRNAVQWRLLLWLIPGVVLGPILGVWLGRYIQTEALQTIFALFCTIVSISFLFPNLKIFKPLPVPEKTILPLMALIIGILSGLLGIGGGLLLIPLLLRLRLTPAQVSATTAACVFPIACSGAITAMLLGTHKILPMHTIGFVYWPAALIIGLASIAAVPTGVFLAHHLSEKTVKRLFGLILLWVAWHMFPFQW